MLHEGWHCSANCEDLAKRVAAKLKNLRSKIRQWQKNIKSLASLISTTMLVLQFLDTLEEFRDLSIMEWNFRILVRRNIDLLLKLQNDYWKQRSKIIWVTLGEENAKFFHANASLSSKRKYISCLVNSDNQLVYSHDNKEKVLWHSSLAIKGQFLIF
jgi:hypothetical protein